MTNSTAELWPGKTDLASVEAVPLADRALPGSTLDLVSHAAARWPDDDALVLLPDATRWPERSGSVGQRLPYQAIKAVAEGRDLPCGEVGTLWINGPTVFPGYLRRDAAGRTVVDPAGKVVNGWLDTGDLGRVDDDGYVYLTGRAKDLIIRGGHNIDPAVIEDALLDHPDVTEANAVGRPDPHSGEVPVAYVTVRAGAVVDEANLRAWAASGVPERAAAPKDVYVVDSLPVTAVGKPFKPALRQDALWRILHAELGDLADAVEVSTVDGVLTVSPSRPIDDAAAAAITTFLDRHGVPSGL